jgi:hypothetical protein
MFAGVYVAKEAIEHILLSAGGHSHSHSGPRSPSPTSELTWAALNASAGGITRGLGLHGAAEMGVDGHHHHRGDEKPEMLGCVVFYVWRARLMDVMSSLLVSPVSHALAVLHRTPDYAIRSALLSSSYSRFLQLLLCLSNMMCWLEVCFFLFLRCGCTSFPSFVAPLLGLSICSFVHLLFCPTWKWVRDAFDLMKGGSEN